MRASAPITLMTCPNGHTIEAPKSHRPVSCPAYSHGVPCNGPLVACSIPILAPRVFRRQKKEIKL